MNLDNNSNYTGGYSHTQPLQVNKKRAFRNNLHHHSNVLLFGSELQRHNDNQVTESYNHMHQYQPSTSPYQQHNLYNSASQQKIQELHNKADNRYWSEYRRQYEESIKAYLQQEKMRLMQQPRQETPAGPASGQHEIQRNSQEEKMNKQEFENWEQGQKEWAQNQEDAQDEVQKAEEYQQQTTVEQPANAQDQEVKQEPQVQAVQCPESEFQYVDHYSSPKRALNPIAPVMRYYESQKPPMYQEPRTSQQSQINPPFGINQEEVFDRFDHMQNRVYPQQAVLGRFQETPKMGQNTYQLEPQNFSIEQLRYIARIQRTSQKQNAVYRNNIQKQTFESEKEKYAKHLEAEVYTALGVKKGEYNHEQGRRIPLGKHVTQMEMTNPEARRHLKEMLEYQMREKEHSYNQNENMLQAKTRLLKQPVTANLIGANSCYQRPLTSLQASASHQLLPPIAPKNTTNQIGLLPRGTPQRQGHLEASQSHKTLLAPMPQQRPFTTINIPVAGRPVPFQNHAGQISEMPVAGVHQSQMQYGPVKFASPTNDGVNTRGARRHYVQNAQQPSANFIKHEH